MKINLLFILFVVTEILCLFDEEIIMEKPPEGKSGLFFRRKDTNLFYISNSVTNYIVNIRNGAKVQFDGIIPSSSTIDEPFIFFVNNKPFYIIDAYSKNKYIKIYDMINDNYKEYTRLEINHEDKRKFCKVNNSDNEFAIGVKDKNNNFHMRVLNVNGTEIFRSQEIKLKGSNDFFIWANISGNNRGIFAIIFYEDEFVLNQWHRIGNSEVYYYEEKSLTNQLIEHNNVQYLLNGYIFACSQENGDINCHRITHGWNTGFGPNTIFNIQMLQGCKSNYKLNQFNNEKYIVSCLNNNNEYIIQLFNGNLIRDFDMNGMIIFKDDMNSNFDYDALQGKDNELVVIKSDISKNKYFLETFNFIKNSKNIYQLCPDGCQNCYFLKELGIRYRNNTFTQKEYLNYSLCKFNRYFADNYGDICFLKKDKPNGYEFIEKYNKFASCDYCCKTGKNNDICNICLNEKKYEFYVSEPDKGRCVQNCTGGYKYIEYDKGICTSSCNERENYGSSNQNINENN